MLTRILGSKSAYISFFQVCRNSRSTSMGRPVTTKGEILSVCPYSGLDDGKGVTSGTHHFESSHGRKKWTNPFRTSQDGLTAGPQMRLRGRIPEYSEDLEPQFHCRPRNQSGHRARDWVCRSNYFAPKSHRAHTRALTHSIPATPLFLCHPPDGRTGWRTRVRTHLIG